jgi:mycothiol synthase
VRLPDGYLIRPARNDDLDAVEALFDASDLADVGFEDRGVREGIADVWRAPRFDPERDTILVMAGDGRVAGYAEAKGAHPEVGIEALGRVHPDHRGRGLGRFLVGWTEHRATEQAAEAGFDTRLWNGVPSVDAPACEMLTSGGYRQVRAFWHMERPLTGDESSGGPPPGVVFKTFEGGSHERSVYEVWRESFSEHFGFWDEPFEDFGNDVFGDPGFDPRLMVLAFDGEEAVGMNWSIVYDHVGFVHILGVRKPWRGRGIAAALLRRGFADLATLGCTTAQLNVDSGNETGAIRLYESVGMTVRREWLLFERPVAAG